MIGWSISESHRLMIEIRGTIICHNSDQSNRNAVWNTKTDLILVRRLLGKALLSMSFTTTVDMKCSRLQSEKTGYSYNHSKSDKNKDEAHDNNETKVVTSHIGDQRGHSQANEIVRYGRTRLYNWQSGARQTTRPQNCEGIAKTRRAYVTAAANDTKGCNYTSFLKELEENHKEHFLLTTITAHIKPVS